MSSIYTSELLAKPNGRMQSEYHVASLLCNEFDLNVNLRELMDLVRETGKKINATAPFETAIGNMTRRILKIIRDEYATLQKGKHEDSDLQQESLQKILMADEVDSDYTKNIPSLKPAIMEHIGEYQVDFESS